MKLGFKVQGLPPIQTGRDDTFRIPHQRHFRFAQNNVLKGQTNPQWRGLVFNRTLITQKMDQFIRSAVLAGRVQQEAMAAR